MLIKKNDRKLIHQYLFEEGVVVAKKDYNLAKHPHINVKNLEVIKALQSLTSKGYVKTQFSWQYYYYSLTDEGIEYLRDYLHLPAEIVPRTFLKTATKPAAGQRQGQTQEKSGDQEYRRRNDNQEKKVGAAGDFKPEFRGGVGRGAARQE